MKPVSHPEQASLNKQRKSRALPDQSPLTCPALLYSLYSKWSLATYQAWGQLHWKVINYIISLWKVAQLYYITITAIFLK